MTALEELQQAEARAEQLRVQLADVTQGRSAAIGQKKTVEQELLRAVTDLEAAAEGVRSRDRTISDLRALVGRHTLLEQAATAERERAESLDRDLRSTKAKLADAERAAGDTSAELADAKAELARVGDSSEKTAALLDALRAKAAANDAIAGHLTS